MQVACKPHLKATGGTIEKKDISMGFHIFLLAPLLSHFIFPGRYQTASWVPVAFWATSSAAGTSARQSIITSTAIRTVSAVMSPRSSTV